MRKIKDITIKGCLYINKLLFVNILKLDIYS